MNSLITAAFRTMLNEESRQLLGRESQITCKIHNCCNGTCKLSAETPPDIFEALLSEGHTVPLPTKLSYPSTVSFPEPSDLEGPQLDIFDRLDEFEYAPLDCRETSIRLIHVEPTVFLDDPVSIAMFDAPLESAPKYAALSYCWGPPVFDHRIICNGQILPVTKSLHGALKRHRRQCRDDPQLIWADQICINQSLKAEINQQIPLMSKIYSSAETVHIDLGDTESDSYEGLDLMNKLVALKNFAKLGPDAMDGFNHQTLESFALPAVDHVAWKTLARIYLAPWWTRTWIIQEAALGSQICVRFGWFCIYWDHFEQAFDFMREYHLLTSATNLERQNTIIIGTAQLNFFRIQDLRNRFRGAAWGSKDRFGPIKILAATREFLTTNDKDRVVGILGMLPPPKHIYLAWDDSQMFLPDYSSSLEEVYHSFAVYMFGTGSKIWGSEEIVRMLSHAGLERHVEASCLPSWAPDWRMQNLKQNAKPLIQMRMDLSPHPPPTRSRLVHCQEVDLTQNF